MLYKCEMSFDFFFCKKLVKKINLFDNVKKNEFDFFERKKEKKKKWVEKFWTGTIHSKGSYGK
jgi:hypothetical protein